MEKKRNRLFAGVLAVILLTAVDQITKYLAKTFLAGTPGVKLIPGVFQLFYLENRGAAFGMMENRQWLFILIAVIMLAAAGYIYLKMPCVAHYRPLRLVCILIAAGAVGNMIDRILWNYVIDFLYFSLIDFPVFNVADCYVCVGAVLAVLLIFTLYREDPFEFLAVKSSCEKKEKKLDGGNPGEQ